MKPLQMRLNKFIAGSSSFSRRKADELIKEGRVFVNGNRVPGPGLIIDPDNDEVKIDGQKISKQKEKIYIALNKPQGYICTRSDEFKRKTIMELVPKGQNLKPVGRLDFNSEGLIFLSNDGDFCNRLTHPRYQCPKEYYAEIDGKLDEKNRKKLEEGIFLEGKKTAPVKIQILRQAGGITTLRIELHEGRKRQIRKMFAEIKHSVKYLQRIRIGTVHLGQLKKGQFRKLTEKEIHAFKSA